MKKEFETAILSNGIRLVHQQVKTTKIVHAGFVLNVGSRDEKSAELGMAHFIEHCIFKGTTTKTASDIIEQSEGLGGELNAYTTKEDTCVYASFTKKHWKSQCDLLVDVLFGATFPEQELKKEKKVIYDEINYYLDSPNDMIYEEFDALLFKNHAIGNPILGTPKSVKNITRKQVKSFVKRLYMCPENSVFICSGDLPIKQVCNYLESTFKAHNLSAHKRKRSAPKGASIFHEVHHKKGHQTHLLLGKEAFSYVHKKNWEMALLNHFFGGNSLNSRLNIVLREQNGLTYQVESSYQPYSDAGMFTVYLSTDAKKVKKVKQLIKQECQALQAGISEGQLEKLKDQFCTQFLLAKENRLNNLLAMGKALLTMNKVHTDQEIIKKIRQVKLKSINAVARQVFAYNTFSSITYIQHTQSPNALLQELERETWAKVLIPRMLAGHYQGRVLSMLSHMIKPKRVLEIGTYTGYSALCWAEGLAKEGLVYTIDKNEELASMVKRFLAQSLYGAQIKPKIGLALEVMPTLNEQWDLVFIDADKSNYLAYYNMVFDQVPIGGYIVADNVLWSGKVLEESERLKDKDTKALHVFNGFVQQDNRVENVLLGIRDGLMIVRKVKE